jgi:hypothetical protein
MCFETSRRPRRVDSVAALATALVAVCGAFATVVAAPIAEPAPALVAAAGVASPPAASR